MADDDQDWQRLAERVVAARVARGMTTRDQLAQKGGFSTRFLGDVENARRTNYDPAYLARLEQSLGWETGSVAAILAGGEPIHPHSGTGDEEDFADLELEVRMILGWDLPDTAKQAILAEALRLRERQIRARRTFDEQQARERRQMVSRWLDQAKNGPQTANG